MTTPAPMPPARNSAIERATVPGWPEIVTGLLTALGFLALTPLIAMTVPDDQAAMKGLVLMGWSVIMPAAGFFAAFLIRIRGWQAFGIRRTTWKWMLAGIGLGVAALFIKGLVNIALTALTGFDESAQGSYADAAGAGILPLVLTLSLLTLGVPLFEEFLFRGVLLRGLLRYGAWVAVIGSSVVFALFHGINMALPSALIVGLVCAEVVRRSGSVWPAVAIHVVNNAALPVLVIIGGPDVLG